MSRKIEIKDIDSSDLSDREELLRKERVAVITFDPLESLIGISVPVTGEEKTNVYYFGMAYLVTKILEVVEDFIDEAIE